MNLLMGLIFGHFFFTDVFPVTHPIFFCSTLQSFAQNRLHLPLSEKLKRFLLTCATPFILQLLSWKLLFIVRRKFRHLNALFSSPHMKINVQKRVLLPLPNFTTLDQLRQNLFVYHSVINKNSCVIAFVESSPEECEKESIALYFPIVAS